jgi:hypothetical protein
MKKYFWYILSIAILLVLGGMYILIMRPVHDYDSCVKAGGVEKHYHETGYCVILGSSYFPVLPSGAIN